MEKNKDKSVFAIFKTRASAEGAVDTLMNEGFGASDISVLLSDSIGDQSLAHTKATKAPEGATAGAGAGLAIGGTLGLLAGIGALAIPGFGPFIAAGPIMGALAGAGVGGAVGGMTGGLIGLGMPEFEAKRYEGVIKDGGVLLCVVARTTEDIERAEECLERLGGKDIATSDPVKGDWKPYERKSDTIPPTTRPMDLSIQHKV